MIVFSPLFALGLFLTSLFKGSLNSSLTQDYENTVNIVEDKRIWVKYTIQNIGSILHQFLLMLLGSLIIIKKTAYLSRPCSLLLQLLFLQLEVLN